VVLAALLIVGLGLRVWYLPAASRLGGEGAGITNIEVALAEGETRKLAALPLAWYPQSLALDLVDRLSDEQTKSRFKVITKKGKVTRRGLHVARVFSLLYGLAGVALLYSIGRRLGSVFIGVAAAVILCFSPWHIQGSVIFTPEILVLALSLLALWLGLQALDDPSSLRFAGVGVALGLAAAADLDGVLVALPVLAALAAAGGRRFGRVLLPLAVAVPVAVLVWWLLTPPLGAYLEALELERASNARRAAEDSSSRFTVIVLGFLYPLLDSVHGRLLGALALLGALGQAIRLLFLVDAGPDRVQRLMVLAAAPVFVLGHAWNTPLYSEVAFLPLVAFS
jgi:4-amino-4-deoxy-L-arabinose transferase-like glycosyltransferase